MKATGRCLCGAVTFTANDVESGFHVCHCSMCRRWSGGPLFSIGVGSVRFDDDTHLKRYESSAWAERGFCGRCGSSLFYRLKSADQYVINLGVFDDQSPFAIAGEIYIEDKPPGYHLAGDHSRMTGDEFLASLQKP